MYQRMYQLILVHGEALKNWNEFKEGSFLYQNDFKIMQLFCVLPKNPETLPPDKISKIPYVMFCCI